jgi:hypothetical protein
MPLWRADRGQTPMEGGKLGLAPSTFLIPDEILRAGTSFRVHRSLMHSSGWWIPTGLENLPTSSRGDCPSAAYVDR